MHCTMWVWFLPYHYRDVPWCPRHIGSCCTHKFHQSTLIQESTFNERYHTKILHHSKNDILVDILYKPMSHRTLVFQSVFIKLDRIGKPKIALLSDLYYYRLHSLVNHIPLCTHCVSHWSDEDGREGIFWNGGLAWIPIHHLACNQCCKHLLCFILPVYNAFWRWNVCVC